MEVRKDEIDVAQVTADDVGLILGRTLMRKGLACRELSHHYFDAAVASENGRGQPLSPSMSREGRFEVLHGNGVRLDVKQGTAENE